MATDFGKFKVAELREELKRLGLPQTGLKAELVARLEEASSAPANTDQQGVTTPSAQTAQEDATIEEEAASQVDNQTDNEHSAATAARTPQKEISPEPQPPIEFTQAHSSLLPSSLEASVTPAPTEVRQDFQARHRRSGSPALSTKDVEQKIVEGVVPAQPSPQPPIDEHDQLMGGTNEELPQDDQIPPAQRDNKLENQPHASNRNQEDAPMDVSRPASRNAQEDVEMDDAEYRHVEQSIHPATNALYIKNFMRPLRPEEVEKYLLELGTPPGAEHDNNLIADFFLDPVKTHALVVFTSTSAASRARNALHDRVWPDETNRKPLWVDFFPPDRFDAWIRQEEGRSGGRRGSANRWEVIYETDADGQVQVELVDTASSQYMERQQQQHGRQRSMSPPGGFGRRPSSSSHHPDIRNAPTGPRNFTEDQGGYGQDDRDGTPRHPGRTLGTDMLETRAFPYVSFKPVSRDLADNRLDALDKAKAKDYSNRMHRGGNKEYHRFYFENGDFLVDRGPEIFIEIRPPRRVREQRRARGGPGGGGGGMRRRRRNGGGRSGGGGFAMYHGVPRGGDRFRPGADSGGGPFSSRFRD